MLGPLDRKNTQINILYIEPLCDFKCLKSNSSDPRDIINSILNIRETLQGHCL